MVAPRPLRHFFIVSFALGAACRTAPSSGIGGDVSGSANPDRNGAAIRLTIVGTNDVHGHLFPQTGKLRDGTAVEQGGVATFAGYLANIRADNPGGVILLDGGDLFQGTLVSNLSEGAV